MQSVTIGSSMMVSHHAITVRVGSSMVSHHTITVTVGSSLVSHCAISHSRVINDGQSPCSHSRVINNGQCDWPSLMTLMWLWLHGDLTIIDDPTVTARWQTIIDDPTLWLHGDLTIIDDHTVTARWLTIIDDPIVTDCMVTDHYWLPYLQSKSQYGHQWWSVTIQSVTVGSSMMVSHRAVTVGSSMMVSHHTISHRSVINDGQSPCSHSHSRVINESLMTLLWLISWWLIIIDLPYCDWLHGDWPSLMTLPLWETIFFQTLAKMMASQCNHSHSRVINDGQSPYNQSQKCHQWWSVTMQSQ
jgi:hypothetical protein